jgi:superfamily I DNA/RNA helicase
MEFRIADTFQSSLGKLNAQEQKAVKTTAFDLQMGLSGNSTQFHKIERAKDPNFWSVRANSDIRLIVHKTATSILLCYVDHHDDAYAWAGRRRIENHPVTGATQIVEVRELVEDVTIQRPVVANVAPETLPAIFDNLDKDQLLSIGVPADWLDDVLSADEETFLRVADHLPQEAAEILLEVAGGDVSFLQAVQQSQSARAEIPDAEDNGFAHPDAQRRFRVVQDSDELSLALDFPWEKWTVFLHPSQRIFAYRSYNGPARVAGSAGTGKTVVAIHRALALHKKYPESRILLTTFTKTLANAMRVKLERLVGIGSSAIEKIDVKHLEGVAYELMQKTGQQPNILSLSQLQSFFKYACKQLEIEDFSNGFLLAEWEHVVDAWQLKSWEDYRDVKRLGRKTRIGGAQREKLWSIFDYVWNTISSRNLTTWPSVFSALHGNSAASFNYANIIIDEAQDISVSELKFVAGLVGDKTDGLFFAGDLGQRIFRQPFSWKSLGVDVRGRSNTLKINYRTSHQIRQQADRLLPKEISDLDENEESRKATISLFNSLPPQILVVDDFEDETSIISDWIKQQVSVGTPASEIGIFVRSEDELPRAKAAIIDAGQNAFKITDKFEENTDAISFGAMHLAKGLEFRSVAVMACDEDVLPQQDRLERVTDASDLAEVYETERHLLYVACTRAREHLLVTGVEPGSEFLEDLENR